MDVLMEKWQELLESGIKFLSAGKYVEAEAYLERSLTQAEELGAAVIIAFSQRLLATVQLRINKVDEAEMGFQRALRYCRELNNHKGMAEALAGLANVFFVRNDYSRAIDLYEQAIEMYPQEASLLRLAVLYSDLGQVYARTRTWEKAVEFFAKAGGLCYQYGYGRGVAESSLFQGEALYSQGKITEAVECFIRAGKIFSLEKDELSVANTLQCLAFIYLEKNNLPEALLCQDRVVILFLKNRQPELSEAYFLLSNILQGLELWNVAEETLKLSLRFYQGYEFGVAVRYHNLAVTAVQKKEYERAKQYYFEALKYFQFFGAGPKVGEISEELTYLIQYEDHSLNRNFYQRLFQENSDPESPKYEKMFLVANILKGKGNYLEALRCSWRALEMATSVKRETGEIEKFVQELSAIIRKRK